MKTLVKEFVAERRNTAGLLLGLNKAKVLDQSISSDFDTNATISLADHSIQFSVDDMAEEEKVEEPARKESTRYLSLKKLESLLEP